MGHATLGRVGFEGHNGYAVIGTVAKLAARLCAVAEPGQIVLSERVYMRIESLVEVASLGSIELKGFRRPVAAYALRGSPEAGPQQAAPLGRIGDHDRDVTPPRPHRGPAPRRRLLAERDPVDDARPAVGLRSARRPVRVRELCDALRGDGDSRRLDERAGTIGGRGLAGRFRDIG